MPRETITLRDGTTLKVGDECRFLTSSIDMEDRWRRGHIREILQGTGVERAIVTWDHDGSRHVISRYNLRALTILLMALLAGCVPDPPVNPPSAGHPQTARAQEDVRAFVGESLDWHPELTVTISWVQGACLERDVYTGERQEPCFTGEYNSWWDPPTAYLIDKWGTIADSRLAHELFHAWSEEVQGNPDSDHCGGVWDLEEAAQARIREWEDI